MDFVALVSFLIVSGFFGAVTAEERVKSGKPLLPGVKINGFLPPSNAHQQSEQIYPPMGQQFMQRPPTQQFDLPNQVIPAGMGGPNQADELVQRWMQTQPPTQQPLASQPPTPVYAQRSNERIPENSQFQDPENPNGSFVNSRENGPDTFRTNFYKTPSVSFDTPAQIESIPFGETAQHPHADIGRGMFEFSEEFNLGEYYAFMALCSQGLSAGGTDIILRMWGIKSGGGKRYKSAQIKRDQYKKKLETERVN